MLSNTSCTKGHFEGGDFFNLHKTSFLKPFSPTIIFNKYKPKVEVHLTFSGKLRI
jgi:hypothetical protein